MMNSIERSRSLKFALLTGHAVFGVKVLFFITLDDLQKRFRNMCAKPCKLKSCHSLNSLSFLGLFLILKILY